MFNLAYLRSFRISDYAVFDIAISFIGIYLLSPLLTRLFHYLRLEIPLTSWLLFTLPLGILAHLLVGTETLMVQQFLDPRGHYLLKFVLITLLALGIKGIKIIN